MFDIGWSEMAIVLLVALIVIGPKDLPRVARNMGKWVAKGRAMAREFQRALEDMAREAELDKVKSEIEKAGRTDLGKTIEKTIDPSGELSQAFEPPVRRQEPRGRRAGNAGQAPPAQPASGSPRAPPGGSAAPASPRRRSPPRARPQAMARAPPPAQGARRAPAAEAPAGPSRARRRAMGRSAGDGPKDRARHRPDRSS